MKRWISIGLLLAGFVVSLAAQQSITRFAVVDMDRITAAYASRAPGAREFSEKSAQVQAQIEALNAELQELTAMLEELKENGGRQAQIRNMESQVSSKTREVQEYIASSFAELEEDRARLVQNDTFITQLDTILRVVAQSEGYSMVLSKQEGSGILWYSPSVDITNKVLERMRTGNTRR
jgi:outer membrane protein